MVIGYSKDKFIKEINKKTCEEKWELHGPTFPNSIGQYCQPLVKEMPKNETILA